MAVSGAQTISKWIAEFVKKLQDQYSIMWIWLQKKSSGSALDAQQALISTYSLSLNGNRILPNKAATLEIVFCVEDGVIQWNSIKKKRSVLLDTSFYTVVLWSAPNSDCQGK